MTIQIPDVQNYSSRIDANQVEKVKDERYITFGNRTSRVITPSAVPNTADRNAGVKFGNSVGDLVQAGFAIAQKIESQRLASDDTQYKTMGDQLELAKKQTQAEIEAEYQNGDIGLLDRSRRMEERLGEKSRVIFEKQRFYTNEYKTKATDYMRLFVENSKLDQQNKDFQANTKRIGEAEDQRLEFLTERASGSFEDFAQSYNSFIDLLHDKRFINSRKGDPALELFNARKTAQIGAIENEIEANPDRVLLELADPKSMLVNHLTPGERQVFRLKAEKQSVSMLEKQNKAEEDGVKQLRDDNYTMIITMNDKEQALKLLEDPEFQITPTNRKTAISYIKGEITSDEKATHDATYSKMMVGIYKGEVDKSHIEYALQYNMLNPTQAKSLIGELTQAQGTKSPLKTTEAVIGENQIKARFMTDPMSGSTSYADISFKQLRTQTRMEPANIVKQNMLEDYSMKVLEGVKPQDALDQVLELYGFEKSLTRAEKAKKQAELQQLKREIIELEGLGKQ